jgi:hypothetical protein
MKGQMKVIGFEKSRQSEKSRSIFLRLSGREFVEAGVSRRTEDGSAALVRARYRMNSSSSRRHSRTYSDISTMPDLCSMVLITRPRLASGQAAAKKTVTSRIGDVVATQKLQQHFAQTKSGVISSEQRTKRVLIERRGHEEWKQGLEEDWQRHLETLQKYVRELLLRNRQLRMALPANEPGRGHGDAINFSPGPGLQI